MAVINMGNRTIAGTKDKAYSCDDCRGIFDVEKNPMLYRIAHIGWGTNERAVDLDNRLYCVGDWESTYGNMMIHFGGYGGIGGVHFSGPSIMDQDFYLDGEPIVKNNKIVHPQCK